MARTTMSGATPQHTAMAYFSSFRTTLKTPIQPKEPIYCASSATSGGGAYILRTLDEVERAQFLL